jgi:predicted aconitase
MDAAPRTRLTADERAMLDGEAGPALQLAMEVISTMAAVAGAEKLIPIDSAHVDSCLYHGTVGLDFAERLVGGGGHVRVPTTLNVSSLDLLHPELIRLDPDTRSRAARLMDAYVEMGCKPTWTCAPYQLPERPAFGRDVCWAESNAIVFANSVLGARTARYGDFIDVCAALTGRVPYAGLHRPEERLARLVVDVAGLPAAAYRADELYPLIGHAVGLAAGSLVPAVVGLPVETNEDQLKALGAAAASSGSVALCHVVGVTPEARTVDDALGGGQPERVLELTAARLRGAWDELSTTDERAELAAVSLGTPHFSGAEFEQLAALLADQPIAPNVTMYVSTARHVLAELERTGRLADLERPRIQLVVDTCTYITPILDSTRTGAVMTNSAKWAWYGPGNLGVEVVFGSLADCVRSAVDGRVIRERPGWLDG